MNNYLRIFIIFAFVASVLSSCFHINRPEMTDDDYQLKDSKRWGKVERKELDLSGFSSLLLSTNMDIIYTQADSFHVCIEGNEKVISQHHVVVEGATLKDIVSEDAPGFMPVVRLRISAPTLSSIDISGAGDVDFTNDVSFDDFTVTMSGSGDIETENMTCGHLKVSMTGPGDLDTENIICKSADVAVEGSGDSKFHKIISEGNAKFLCSGAGNIKAKVKSNNIKVMSLGAGDTDIEASCNKIEATASGTGNMELSGEATELIKEESGLSKINTKKLIVEKIVMK